MIAAGRLPLLQSRHLEIMTDRDGIVISYKPPVALTLGSDLRGRDIRSRVKSALKRGRPFARDDEGDRVVASFSFDTVDKLKNVIPKIDLMLDAYRHERLTSKMVEEILGITAVERRRWSKDRRLSHSGMASHRRGRQSFRLPLYAPKHIAWLAANPNIVSQWREEDAARPFASQPSSAMNAKSAVPLSTSR